MPILKKFTTAGGLELAWHRVVKAEAGFLDQHSVITLTVYSWPSMEAYIANQGQRFSWQEYVTIPQIRVDGTDFLGSCERAVVDLPESPYFQGAITTLPSDLTLARDLRWAQMKQMRDFAASQPIDVNGQRFDADAKSVDNIRGAIQGMEIAGATSIAWTLFDNSVTTLTLDQLRAVGVAILSRVDACYQKARDLRTQIEAATTVEAVAAVVW